MAKEKFLLSLDGDTLDRLRQIAGENHKTVAQTVTDWVWAAPVKHDAPLRGQMQLKTKSKS